MEKIRCRALSRLAGALLVLPFLVQSAMAATAVIRGQVKDNSGKPLGGTLIVADISGGSGYLQHETVFATTAADGTYEIQTVSPPQAQFYQIIIHVLRRTAPFFRPVFDPHDGPTIERNSPLTLNYTLTPISNGAVVDGVLTDKQFGQVIPSQTVSNVEGFGSPVRTFSNGYYLMTLSLPNTNPRILNFSAGGASWGLGLRYQTLTQGKLTVAGQAVRKDLSLGQDAQNAAYVFGRVVNGATGQPLPHASIFYFAQNCQTGSACQAYSGFFPSTDQFGRFVMDLNIPRVLERDSNIVLRATGAQWSNQGPRCTSQDRIVTPVTFIGSSKEVNFDLSSCP